ncbi:alpha/beta fold hydrolase [Burkholderia alba]|uniref:alpha/beta fold hydrolase n=1 Tax=Burkholderia alba TaxID=2683677 RepID=UPI002B05B008|nr:alpha/beta fold hydrolase [Burkholderia alba]
MSDVLRVDDFTFVSYVDGTAIYGRRWLPPSGAVPRAVIQVTHGIAEHSGRYDRFARALARDGYAVYALDLRAHGNTALEGQLGIAGVDAWTLMKADIRQLGEIARQAYPDLPLVAFGHSMGSALTQGYIQEHGSELAGVILCGTMGSFPGESAAVIDAMLPALKAIAESPRANEISEFMRTMLTSFNTPYAGSGAVTGGEWMTRDLAEQAKFFADPLCGKLFCNGLLYSVVEGFQSLWTDTAEACIPRSLPILIICGAEDPVGGETQTVQHLVTRYMKQGHRHLSYIVYPDARHEILNEACKETVHRDVIGWLSAISG